MSKNYKKPRSLQHPQRNKIPRAIEDPGTLGSFKFRWRVNDKYIDYEHDEWGWSHLTCKDFFKILTDRLHEYEDMTWDDLSKRQSCHPMPVENIVQRAQDRLCELCDATIDSLYQIDINPKCRLWGYRIKTIFYLIWHDPNHTIYSTTKRK